MSDIDKDLEELKWWREVIAVRFVQGKLPPVGTNPNGVSFTTTDELKNTEAELERVRTAAGTLTDAAEKMALLAVSIVEEFDNAANAIAGK